MQQEFPKRLTSAGHCVCHWGLRGSKYNMNPVTTFEVTTQFKGSGGRWDLVNSLQMRGATAGPPEHGEGGRQKERVLGEQSMGMGL